MMGDPVPSERWNLNLNLKGICEQLSELQPLGWGQAESPNFRYTKKLGKTLGI